MAHKIPHVSRPKVFMGIPKYIPEVCPLSKRIGNHFECTKHALGCPQIYEERKYICPSYGKSSKDGSWIEITDAFLREKIDDILRWNKCRRRIPHKDIAKLKGYEGFTIYNKEIIIEQFSKSDVPMRKKQIIELINNGDKLIFNEDWGVGNIERTNKGYTVIKYVCRIKSIPVVDGTIDDVINFLLEFWELGQVIEEL